MMSEHEDAVEYCRKMAEPGRYIVVDEYEAIEANVQKIEGEKPAEKVGE